MHLNFIIHTMLVEPLEHPARGLCVNASPPRLPPHHPITPTWTCSFKLGSKPLMESAECCLKSLTQSLVKYMNGCTCLCWCPGRCWRRFYADLHRQMPSLYLHKFGYTTACFFFFFSRYGFCQMFPNNENAMQFFFVLFLPFKNTDFDCGVVLLVVLSMGLNL